MPLGRRDNRTIYGLASSEDGEIRYVGSTQRPVAARLADHLRSARSAYPAAPVQFWIRSVLAAGFEVRLTVLIESGSAARESTEIARRMRARRSRLLNVVAKGCPRNHAAYLSLGVPMASFTSQVQADLLHLRWPMRGAA